MLRGLPNYHYNPILARLGTNLFSQSARPDGTLRRNADWGTDVVTAEIILDLGPTPIRRLVELGLKANGKYLLLACAVQDTKLSGRKSATA